MFLQKKYDNVINIAEELLNDKYADKDSKNSQKTAKFG